VPQVTTLRPGDLFVYAAHIDTTLIKDISFEDIVPVNRAAPITVCDALQHRGMYDGHFVEIRGRFYGNSLADECEALHTETFEWPSIIQLAFPQGGDIDEPATWNVDLDWYNRVVADSAKIGTGSGRRRRAKKVIHLEEPIYGPALSKYLGVEDDSPLATVIGRFDSRENIDVKRNGDGEHFEFGYGHLNQLPARLVIVDVRDFAQFDKQKRRGNSN
jgi:hypothetical protein